MKTICRRLFVGRFQVFARPEKILSIMLHYESKQLKSILEVHCIYSIANSSRPF